MGSSFNNTFLFSLVLFHLLFPIPTDSLDDATLIPLTIFDCELTRDAAIEWCDEEFGVQLASSDFALGHLKHVVDEGIENLQVWTGLVRDEVGEEEATCEPL